jgi:hypothetical protein
MLSSSHRRERVWRNGSASASQAEGCGFESRRPLQVLRKNASRVPSDNPVPRPVP